MLRTVEDLRRLVEEVAEDAHADGAVWIEPALSLRGSGVVGFGLGGDERHPPEPFAPAFRIVREAGLLSLPHAGELAGPASVRGALDGLGADRILHGVRTVEDPGLVVRLAATQTPLDVCPTSNLAFGVVESLAAHPLPALLQAGVRCSVNADGPLLLGTTLLDEYELCRREFGFDDRRLAAIARTSIESSAAPEESKRTALADIDSWC